MASYFIGDVHGCYDELAKMLDTISYQPSQDKLLFTGDLVGRGSEPYKTLRFVHSLQQENPEVKVVLGNHDLHLIAIYFGGYDRDKNHDATLNQIIDASDAQQIIEWLLHQSLLYWNKQDNYVLVHAGIPHIWSIEEAASHAIYAEQQLQSTYASGDSPDNSPDNIPAAHIAMQKLMSGLYGNQPSSMDEVSNESERLRIIINYLTRMRFCTAEGKMELSNAGAAAEVPANCAAWFDYARKEKTLIVFGHWSAIRGVTSQEKMLAMDYGCAWGLHLAAKRLEDGKLFKVARMTNNTA